MGPLQGVKVIEVAGIGPGQFCGMLLADMGADIIRIVRPGQPGLGLNVDPKFDLMNRGRSSIETDLKDASGRDLVLALCEKADALFEGFRPGVMERLGLGPDDCMARNERLVYGRMTGFGQDGPLANRAGHDTNYIALSGALHAMGDRDRPPPLPLNLVGDFGGGGAFLATGLLAAIIEAGKSGKGQVVDAAMIDGAASMLTAFYGLMAAGAWRDRRQSNFLDGGAPFARCYETSDGKYVAVCALENHFFAELIGVLEIAGIDPADQYDDAKWPEHQEAFARTFATRTRDEWSSVLENTDACASPVLSLSEAPIHPHNAARETFTSIDDILQPSPAPRFSRTRSEAGTVAAPAADDGRAALSAWGFTESEIGKLI